MKEINENDEIIEKINDMLKNVNKMKNEGNNFIKQKKYADAENIYKNAINIMNNFETEDKFEMNSIYKKEKGKEIIITLKNLYSNLALSQGKQLKLIEAIQTSNYILTNLDGFHDKSYIRILNWLLELNEIKTAKELKEEIINKFSKDKLTKFKTVFNLITLKDEELNNKIIQKNNYNKNQGFFSNNFIKIGTTIFGLSLLILLGLRVHKKYI